MRYSRLLPLAALAACTLPPPMPPVEPTQLTSTMTPAVVIQTAVQTLSARGFTVTSADASGGIAVARKAFSRGDSDIAKELLACHWGPNAAGWHMISGLATVTVTARPVGAGSVVTIAATTEAGSPGECVTSGKAEAAIASTIAK